jgi:hypothetical protein
VVQKDTDGRWYLVGITSYGVGCGSNLNFSYIIHFFLVEFFKNLKRK